jgi:hypothetical protein
VKLLKTALNPFWLLLTLAAPIGAGASELPLRWGASPTAGVTNYVLYVHTNGTLVSTNLSTALVRQSVGTNCSWIVYDCAPGIWYFTATAMKDGWQSDPSNILGPLECPKGPTNLLPLILQYTTTLTNPAWIDCIFFKLKPGPP